MVECNKEENKKDCNCTYSCEKKGLCCKCISYHRRRNELPACYFPDNVERTYDRTIENFVKVYQNK